MGKNKLQIHPEKSKYMFVASPHTLKNNINDHPVSINNIPVAGVRGYSCFGVKLNERLSWGSHIDYICSKVGAGIGLIRRTKHFVSPSTLKMLYHAIVLPYFDYCSPLWDNCGSVFKDKLSKFQNRAARVITGKSYDVPSVDLLADLQWTPLEKRRINSNCYLCIKSLMATLLLIYEINSNSIMKWIAHIILETVALI